MGYRIFSKICTHSKLNFGFHAIEFGCLAGCCGGVLGFASCFLIIRYSAINSRAAVMADVAPIMYQACQAGKKVSRYRRDPMSMNNDADPAIEIPNASSTALVIDKIKSFFTRAFRAVSCLSAYSLSAAFTSSRKDIMAS